MIKITCLHWRMTKTVEEFSEIRTEQIGVKYKKFRIISNIQLLF